ncbi:MAG: hypothetical protein ACYDIC_20525 [Desulfobaccales bacterium]
MEFGESEIKKSIIKILLEEYKRHSDEILKKIGFSEQINNFFILLIGAEFAALIQILLSQACNKDIILALYFILCPFPFYFLALIAHNHSDMVISNARYINMILKPKIISIIKEKDILLWENYMTEERKWKSENMPYAKYGHWYLLPLFIPFICIVIAPYYLYKCSLFWIAPIYLVNIGFFYYIIYSRRKTNDAYKRIVE